MGRISLFAGFLAPIAKEEGKREMEVRELVKLLKKLDQTARVMTRDHDNSYDEVSGYVRSVSQQHSSEITDWRGYSENIVVIEC